MSVAIQRCLKNVFTLSARGLLCSKGCGSKRCADATKNAADAVFGGAVHTGAVHTGVVHTDAVHTGAAQLAQRTREESVNTC